MTLPDFGFRSAITDTIHNLGTTFAVGVFVGTALTTGVAAGIASWYFTNKLSVVSGFNNLTSKITDIISKSANPTEELQEQSQTIIELSERIVQLEINFRHLKGLSNKTAASTSEVEL
jgi:hypothetical protein